MECTGKDFVVSELLSELKADGARKDLTIKSLQKNLLRTIIASFIVIVLIVGAFLLYLNQYDFSSTQTVENTAEGVYALIDSEGNTIAWDITPEELQCIMEMIDYGEGQN